MEPDSENILEDLKNWSTQCPKTKVNPLQHALSVPVQAARKSQAVKAHRVISPAYQRYKKLIDWELSKVGMHERGYSNTGNEIDRWERECGFYAQPYCALFQIYGLKHLASIHLPCNCAYTPNIYYQARDKRGPFKGLYPINHRMRGDLQLMKFSAGDIVQHVGLYIGKGKTIEANTSPGNGGSQANGGGIYIRNRPSSCIVGYARVF